MKWYRRSSLLDYLRGREATGYVLLACAVLALLQAIFMPSAFSVLILVALLVIIMANTRSGF
ncbi:MAG: hypothetical protein ACM3XN_04340 [Chloroflexota bacterium]